MPPATRASVKASPEKSSAAAPAEESGLKGTVAPTQNTKSLPSTLPAPSSSLFKYVILLPLLSLAVTAAVSIRSMDLLRQTGVVALMSVGGYFATLRLIPLSATTAAQHTHNAQSFARAVVE